MYFIMTSSRTERHFKKLNQVHRLHYYLPEDQDMHTEIFHRDISL